ncbi:MAG: response regulator [bacterium]
MNSSEQTKILIVDDDPDTRDIIRLSLNSHAYRISEARTGVEALEKVVTHDPDIIVLDVMLPEKSGMEVCKALKESTVTAHVPVIMLTAKQTIDDKVEGLNIGADDYLIKPFDPVELEARIKALLRKMRRDLYANPLTHLPGNVPIEKEIQRAIDEQRKFAALFIDLDNFKVYNDNYGYAAGNRIIKFCANTILDSVKRFGNANDFTGHIGGDDFVVLTTPDKADQICKEIIRIFDSLIPIQYNEEDVNRGYVISEDRRGEIKKFPLMTISIVVITNENNQFIHHLQVAEKAAELKKHVKRIEGSKYRKDRRKSGAAQKNESTD